MDSDLSSVPVHPNCENCGYSLFGQVERRGRCPECGSEFDMAAMEMTQHKSRRFLREHFRSRAWNPLAWTAIGWSLIVASVPIHLYGIPTIKLVGLGCLIVIATAIWYWATTRSLLRARAVYLYFVFGILVFELTTFLLFSTGGFVIDGVKRHFGDSLLVGIVAFGTFFLVGAFVLSYLAWRLAISGLRLIRNSVAKE